jgi:hypothetical protein
LCNSLLHNWFPGGTTLSGGGTPRGAASFRVHDTDLRMEFSPAATS